MTKNSNKGIARIVSAFMFSLSGFKKAYLDEASFRQEFWIVLVASIIALCLNITFAEKALLISSLLFVLVVELLNTGIEALADKITEDYDPLIGKAKDVGSAAVLLAIFMAILCWAAVLV